MACRVAWVTRTPETHEPLALALEHSIKDLHVHFLNTVAQALDEIAEQEYDLIVTSLLLDSGNLRNTIKQYVPPVAVSDHCKAAVYLLEQLQQTDHAPLIVATMIHPEKDLWFPDAERAVRSLGAQEYIYLWGEAMRDNALIPGVTQAFRKYC